jgi:hypothetical protein
MIGLVQSWHPDSHIGFIEGRDEKVYYVHEKQIRPDEYCLRYLCVGEDVRFDPMPTKIGRHDAAKNVVPARLENLVQTPADFRDEFEIVSISERGNLGSVVRPNNTSRRPDWISFLFCNIISELPKDFKVGIGTRLWAGLERSPDDPAEKFFLHSIEVCIPPAGGTGAL